MLSLTSYYCTAVYIFVVKVNAGSPNGGISPPAGGLAVSHPCRLHAWWRSSLQCFGTAIGHPSSDSSPSESRHINKSRNDISSERCAMGHMYSLDRRRPCE